MKIPFSFKGPSFMHKSTAENAKTDSNTACLIAWNDLSFGDTLGSGNFGLVKKAIWRPQNKKSNKEVAVKILKPEFADKVSELIKEIGVMHQLDHRHLVKLLGVCFDKENLLVTELAPLGCLLYYLRDNKAKIAVTRLVDYATQLADALNYLESKSFIHRDIALRNVLLASENTIKLGDFGLARVLEAKDNNEQIYSASPFRMVPYAWAAPESLKRLEFTHASDTWMYGIALWEMFSFGEEPWYGLDMTSILKLVESRQRLAKPLWCPTSLFQMMLQCWRTDPDNRPTFAAIHHFLKSGFFLEVKATADSDQQSDAGKLTIKKGDKLVVIDGDNDKMWWYGQNKRTNVFGFFLWSKVEMPHRGLLKDQISRPLPGTFVHNNRRDPKEPPLGVSLVPAPELAGHHDGAFKLMKPTDLPTRRPNGRTSNTCSRSDGLATLPIRAPSLFPRQQKPTAPPLDQSQRALQQIFQQQNLYPDAPRVSTPINWKELAYINSSLHRRSDSASHLAAGASQPSILDGDLIILDASSDGSKDADSIEDKTSGFEPEKRKSSSSSIAAVGTTGTDGSTSASASPEIQRTVPPKHVLANMLNAHLAKRASLPTASFNYAPPTSSATSNGTPIGRTMLPVHNEREILYDNLPPALSSDRINRANNQSFQLPQKSKPVLTSTPALKEVSANLDTPCSGKKAPGVGTPINMDHLAELKLKFAKSAKFQNGTEHM